MKLSTSSMLLIGPDADGSDIRYWTRFEAPDPFFFLNHDNKHYLLTNDMESGRAAAASINNCILSQSDLPIKKKDRTLSAWALGLLRLFKLERIGVSERFPYAIAKHLIEHAIAVDVLPDPIFAQRACKNEQEIACIREVQTLTVAAMHRAIDFIGRAAIAKDRGLMCGRKPLTSEQVRHEIDSFLFEHHCLAEQTIVACGVQAADPHVLGSGKLYAGQPIVIDIFPRHRGHGYWGDMTRTVVRGPAADAVVRMIETVKLAQLEALRCVKPMVQVGSVHKACVDLFRQHGYKQKKFETHVEGFIHGTGHGVGLDIHEAPRVSKGRKRLKPGHVITIEPGLYYRDLGGARIEDTIVVTNIGWSYMATMEKVWFL